MMTSKFDKIMESITEVNKIYWIVGFFGLVVIANFFGYGGG